MAEGRWPSRRALVLLVAATVAYLAVAVPVPPGFFDGLTPPGPYRWVSPPARFAAGNQPPLTGVGVVSVGPDGRVPPGSIITADTQAALSFGAGAFVPPRRGGTVRIAITPERRFPDPGPLSLVTNVYCFRASSPVAPGHTVQVGLAYSAYALPPAAIYGYGPDGHWRRFPVEGGSSPYTVTTSTDRLGCFAAGSPRAAADAATTSGGLRLPMLVGLLIVLLLLAGAPLLLRRWARGSRGRAPGDVTGGVPGPTQVSARHLVTAEPPSERGGEGADDLKRPSGPWGAPSGRRWALPTARSCRVKGQGLGRRP